MKKAVGILALSVLFCLAGYTQNNEWISELQKEGVEVYYKVQQCNGLEVVVLKIKNTNNYAVNMNWANELKLETAPGLSRSDFRGDGSGISTISLAAGETMEGSCTAGALTVDPSTMSSMPPLPILEYNMVNANFEKQ